MTTNIFSVMNTAKLGLLAQQMAIEVTGQNIANVQTPGYSRQEVSLEATTPRTDGQAILGTGVNVKSVKRAHDQFVFGQLTNADSANSSAAVQKNGFDQLEGLFNQSVGQGLSQSFSSFYTSVQSLVATPTSLAERTSLLAQAQSLASGLNQMGQRLQQQQQNMDQTVDTEVTSINNLTAQIADLNKGIHASETGTLSANDLRDKRDTLVRELAKKIDITVVTETNGQVSLTLNNGQGLVLGNTAYALQTQVNGNNNGFKDVLLSNGAGGTTNITSLIQGGELRGLLNMRDTQIASLRDKLDRLTAGFVRETNRIHQNGLGLDGVSGRNFFNALTPTVINNTQNTGNAKVSMTNASPGTVSVDKYEFTATGANTVSLKNLTTGMASGTFTFAPGAVFNVAGGLAVTITGALAVGDRFRFSVSENAATSIAVDNQILSDPKKIAAGRSSPGDAENARDMAALQTALNSDGISLTRAGSGTATFNDVYNSMVAALGVAAQTTQTNLTEQGAILLQLQNRRDSADGVSLDEEMINMIKFQQAYGASARVLSTVQELFNVLMNKM